ncbi:hypothetical protein LP419_28765 [Massilia sp. H-1]|nr:hypothetical protein LP419_28765 [Massilia sp. H-1]
MSTGSVINSAAATGHNYQLTFAVSGTPMGHHLQRAGPDHGLAAADPACAPCPTSAGSRSPSTAWPSTSRACLPTATPSSLQPSQKQSIFETLTDLIGVLNAAGSGPVGQASLTNGLNKAHENLGSALDNVLSVRASVGARLKEIDTLDSA